MTKQLPKHLIEQAWCKGCGICIHFCPKNVLEFNKQEKASAKRLEDCIGCRTCEFRCPDLAIQVTPVLKKTQITPQKVKAEINNEKQ